MLAVAVLAMVGLSAAAWLLASSPDTDTDSDGQVGDAASPGPTRTSSTPSLEPKIERYVALGDSMTSAPYLPEIDPAGGCNRSSQNYPSQIAEALDVPDFVDVSCGGAETRHMTASQFAEVGPQFDALTRGTDLVTLTLGGNDFDTYQVAVGCRTLTAVDPQGTPCRDKARAGGEDALFGRIDAIGPLLEDVLAEIHERAPDAIVVMVSYPRLVPSSGTCPEILPFATGDYAYLDTAMRRLADVQRAAADATDTEFLDMYAASQGHDPCASEPWMNGETVIEDGPAPWHAFPAGQAAIADGILALLD